MIHARSVSLICAYGAFLFPAFSQPVPGAESSPARSRIVRAHDRAATRAFEPDPERVGDLFNRGLLRLTGKTNLVSAWRSLLSTQDVVGLKVVAQPGPLAGTRLSVVAAAVAGLLEAGVPAQQIVIWDKRQRDLEEAGFQALCERYGVNLAGSAEAGYDEQVFYENALIGNLVWGDLEFGKKGESVGRRSFVSSLVSRKLTKIINISPLLNHNKAGVNGCLYSLALGSIDNSARFESAPERLATALPEIFALPALGDRVVLNVIDALLCQYQGELKMRLHYSIALNEIWLSKDPVALDVHAIEELDRQRQAAKVPAPKENLEIYRNASLLDLGTSDLKLVDVETVR